MSEQDAGMADRDFDFERFYREARLGHAALLGRRGALEAKIEAARGAIADAEEEQDKIAAQLVRLEQILGAAKSAPTRKSNVQALVIAAVDFLAVQHGGKPFQEGHVVFRVMQEDSEMKEKSIQAVLFRMAKSGKLARHGKRGAYEYTLLVPGNDVDPGLPHGDKPTAEDRIVEVIAQKPHGASEKDIAWATGDLAVAHPILRSLIERGSIEEHREEGGEVVYRIVSKEPERRLAFGETVA